MCFRSMGEKIHKKSSKKTLKIIMKWCKLLVFMGFKLKVLKKMENADTDNGNNCGVGS